MTRIEDLSPTALLDAALRANSAGRVLVAALRGLLVPRPRVPFAHELSPHLQRDLGLAPHAPPPLPSEILR